MIDQIARHLPKRVIMNEHGPYLERYTLKSERVPQSERTEGAMFYLSERRLGTSIGKPEYICCACGDSGMVWTDADTVNAKGSLVDCGFCQSFVYLHKFLASDATTELHDHPWDARVTILAGSYIEHREGPALEIRRPGHTFDLKSYTKHRVELNPSDTCVCGHERSAHKVTDSRRTLCADCCYHQSCDEYKHDGSLAPVWTICEVGPRIKSWGFTDIATGRYTPCREALRARGLL